MTVYTKAEYIAGHHDVCIITEGIINPPKHHKLMVIASIIRAEGMIRDNRYASCGCNEAHSFICYIYRLPQLKHLLYSLQRTTTFALPELSNSLPQLPL
jgi:hypothetical protein